MSQYMIIGNSAAGLAAMRALKAHDPGAAVTVISAERRLPYSRVLLTELIAGKIKRCRLDLVEPDFYQRAGINLIEGMPVVGIDHRSHIVTLAGGEQLPYAKLLLAAGSAPVFPNGYTPTTRQVAGLRTVEDADKILCYAKPGSRVAVVGGGPVGVKLAYALREAGAVPELIVSSPQLLSQVADDEAAYLVQKRMAEHGVRIRTGVNLAHLELNPDGTGTLYLSDQTELCCNLVVFCKGVRPNTEQISGLFSPGRSLRVDKWMRTAFEDIYAAGDLAETFEITRRTYCLAATWPHAVQQGRLAGMNMAGCRAAYSGSLFRNAMEIFGLPFISIGLIRTSSAGNWDVRINRARLSYRKLVYRDNRLVGAQLVGAVGEAGALQAEIRRKAAQDEPAGT